jgi:1-acyl-sn-glycerol-3-phosphate acyltransferase
MALTNFNERHGPAGAQQLGRWYSFTGFTAWYQLSILYFFWKEHHHKFQSFNIELQKRLQPLLYEIEKNNTPAIKQKMAVKISPAKKILLAIPAVVGYVFHWPLYFFIQRFAWKKASHNDHYDSILVGLLFILYPMYLLLINAVLLLLTKCWYLLSLIILAPFCAWSFVQVKKQF